MVRRHLSVDEGKQLTIWQRWIRQPQKIWLRRALFQAHLWSGIGVGLYVLMISVTGSVLVYRNELYRATTPEPIISKASGPRLTDNQLTQAAGRQYPGYRVLKLVRPRNPDQAVDVWLQRGGKIRKRLFDPRTGSDLGDTVPMGIWLVSELLDLHDNLLGGMTGRNINGVGAVAVLGLAVTGLVIWWPGAKTWRRSLTLPRGVGWKRLTWHLHSMIGFWSLAFTVIFGLSAIYLVIPDFVQDLADRIEPPTAANAGKRISDQVIYWLAYLHFGRINGIGIPCHGPGLCDQATKAVWALFGLAPAAMFVTGAIMWWNRVLRPRQARARRQTGSAAVTAS
ncbi:MAG TPA: PepSY-associated TM helix domain-containing protein [Bryobacteraceae bacterium]|nr:PepSY-associated TM helix domain-containing protein [Bryobacteraceae bacterium]